MAKYRNYVMAQSLNEAYELNQKKSSVIVAGNMWLRMCGLNKMTAIDLSGDALLRRRYGFRKETDKLEKLRQVQLYELI